MSAAIIEGSDASRPETFDPTLPYALHPKVALRPEPFGAMAYHYGNRRLNFLRHHDLVTVVESLPDHPSIDATLVAAGIAETRRPSFRSALSKLAASTFIIPRD